jgi:hypothetical protein
MQMFFKILTLGLGVRAWQSSNKRANVCAEDFCSCSFSSILIESIKGLTTGFTVLTGRTRKPTTARANAD